MSHRAAVVQNGASNAVEVSLQGSASPLLRAPGCGEYQSQSSLRCTVRRMLSYNSKDQLTINIVTKEYSACLNRRCPCYLVTELIVHDISIQANHNTAKCALSYRLDLVLINCILEKELRCLDSSCIDYAISLLTRRAFGISTFTAGA